GRTACGCLVEVRQRSVTADHPPAFLRCGRSILLHDMFGTKSQPSPLLSSSFSSSAAATISASQVMYGSSVAKYGWMTWRSPGLTSFVTSGMTRNQSHSSYFPPDHGMTLPFCGRVLLKSHQGMASVSWTRAP